MFENKHLEALQSAIRNYEIEGLNLKIVEIMESLLGQFGQSFVQKDLELFNDLLEGMLNAIQNSDYQLLDDFIEFELKPFCKNMSLSKEF